MKNLLLLTLFLTTLTSTYAQEINWVSLEDAIALQQKEPKKIIMDVYTNWCGPCKLLDKRTFKNKDVANYINEHFYAVKFNGEGNATVTYKENTFSNPQYKPELKNRRNSSHQFTRYMRVNAFPTLVFFDEKGDFITPVKGFQTPQQLELYLKLFKTDKYKEMTDQETFNTYYKAFKPEFKS